MAIDQRMLEGEPEVSRKENLFFRVFRVFRGKKMKFNVYFVPML